MNEQIKKTTSANKQKASMLLNKFLSPLGKSKSIDTETPIKSLK